MCVLLLLKEKFHMSPYRNFLWIPMLAALLASACAASGSGEKNRPDTECTATTCVAEGAVCGTIDDGCGVVLNCGGCPQGEVCGGEKRNKCGTTLCTPTTCQAQGLNCGTISNGCEGELVCGTCDDTQICGSEAPNVCGAAPAPRAGDVLITEIMKNPDVVSDTVGEWFEVHNPGTLPLQLGGCVIADLGNDTATIAGASLIIGAGEYIVLGVNGDSAVNGRVSVTYDYGSINDFRLAGYEDEVIVTCGGVEVDQVAYDNDTFPDDKGVSLTLDPELFDSELNDDAAAWCNATSTYGAGDRGTPGAPNDACVL